VAIVAQVVTATTHSVLGFTGQIQGRCVSNLWSYGDGTTQATAIYAGHAWSATGDFAVVLRAYNLTYLQGIAATVTIHVVSAQATAKIRLDEFADASSSV